MQSDHPLSTEEAKYYFTRVKDTHEEEGRKFITLFARLSVDCNAETKTAWVELEEVNWSGAPEKMKKMPDAMRRFTVSKPVFEELVLLSKKRHQELYFLTPIYCNREVRRLIK